LKDPSKEKEVDGLFAVAVQREKEERKSERGGKARKAGVSV